MLGRIRDGRESKGRSGSAVKEAAARFCNPGLTKPNEENAPEGVLVQELEKLPLFYRNIFRVVLDEARGVLQSPRGTALDVGLAIQNTVLRSSHHLVLLIGKTERQILKGSLKVGDLKVKASEFKVREKRQDISARNGRPEAARLEAGAREMEVEAVDLEMQGREEKHQEFLVPCLICKHM